MTAVVGRTTSHGLTNAALPYLMLAAEFGPVSALEREPALLRGLVLYQGRLVHAEVASALNREAYIISGIGN